MPELPLVLVVEYEFPLQFVVKEALAKGGFEPTFCPLARKHWSCSRAGPNYMALVTDVNVNGRMNGWEVARRIREADPGFPVVYMTGAAADQWASQGVPNSILLEKPFADAQLVTAVSQLLNTGSPPAAPA
jgi:CheY-like chemotaxis protein